MHDKSNEKDSTFGSFYLGASEFAMAVKSIQEVVVPPESYTIVPLAPPHLRGMFNLRGVIVPVVDLAVLLGLESPVDDPDRHKDSQKVVVIDTGNFNFGLLVSRTSEILKKGSYEHFEFNKRDGGAHYEYVSGALKLDNGKRLIQIIDAEALLKVPGLAQPLSENSLRGKGPVKNRGARRQCISFDVGPSTCAMGIEAIQEIIKIDKIHASALAVGHCIGMVDLRGVTVPVIDFASLLGHRETDRSDSATSGERRVIVMRQGAELFGLLVDKVDSIVSYFADEISSFPSTTGSDRMLFSGTISRSGEKDILLLNCAEILTHSQIEEITRGHSMLYNSGSLRKNSKSDRGVRKTFITFRLNDFFAVSIDEVREIVDLPEELLHPPGLPAHFKGVLNLRGKLVAVADGRTLYSMEPKKRSGTEKILVFENGDSKYGLTVDSVESIANVNDVDKVRLPAILYRNNTNPASEDVREAVEWTTHDNRRVVLMMLSLESLAKRIAA